MSDITRQRETELQAREESEFRRAMLGGSAYGLEICLKANTWRYLWHNDAVKMLRTSGDYDAALMSGFVADTVAREDFSAFLASMTEMEAIIRETGDERNYGEWMLESVYQVYPDLTAMRRRKSCRRRRW